MPRKQRKVPKMTPEDVQNVLHELDAWCRGERPGRLGWKFLVAFSGFSRQALSSHDEIAERYGQVKAANRPAVARKAAPKSVDQRIIDLQRELESLKAVVNRYDERWARYARNAALRGIDLAALDAPMDPPARANVRSHRSKAGRSSRRSRFPS